MAIPAARSCLLTLLASGAVLGPAANTVSGTSAAPIDQTRSCASQGYKALKDRSDTNNGAGNSPAVVNAANSSTLLVVPGNPALHLNTTTYVGMGRQIPICIMGLHDWTYVQITSPTTCVYPSEGMY